MVEIPYRKYHGTGNDFAVVEAEHLQSDRSRFGIEVCDELDADGVLFLHIDQDAEPPTVGFRLVQPDGSTAGMCGNGARVAARWAMERTGDREFVLDTPAGKRRTTVHEDERVTVEMDTPTFSPAAIPVEAEEPVIEESIAGFEITAVDTGVPHAVALVDDIDGIDIDGAAPPIRHAERFPEGANVTFAQPDDSLDFRQRTFERGVEGETLSCGTGAVAIAAVAIRLGLAASGEVLEIAPPGGVLRVSLPVEGAATLEGPTTFEFEDAFGFETGAET